MDANQFDALTTWLTARLTRRRLGKLGAVMPVGLVLAEGVDGNQRKKTSCPPCVGRKKGKCKRTLPDGALCRGGTCQGGERLPCPAGQR